MANTTLTDTTTRKNLMPLFSLDEPSNKALPMDVFLRVRGFTREESKKRKEKCVEITHDSRIVVNLPKDSATYKNLQNGGNVKHQFTFSQIFGPDVDQKAFYESTIHSTIQRFLWGENCLIFAYGATNSGKTYTVQGPLLNPGILPRSLDVIFNSIGNQIMDPVIVKPNYYDNIMKLSVEGQKQERLNKDHLLRWGFELDSDASCITDSLMTSRMAYSISSDESTMSSRSCENLAMFKDAYMQIESRFREEMKVAIPNLESFAFSVWISFAEIYNEYVYDLLQPFTNTRSKKRTSLKLAEDKNGNVFVKGLQRICVSNANEAMKLLIVGQKNLRFAVTKLNQNSSRSHCIFNVEIVRVTDTKSPTLATISRLSFCDLAGSERYSKTKNAGDRLKEACNINTSLLVLGRCISTLRSNQHMTKESLKLIPFRESKLTRLFQNFFQRHSAISMIVNISPEPSLCDESLHVLKFSALAEKVLIVPLYEEKPKRTKASILMENAAARTSVPWLSSEDGSEDDDDSETDVDKEELFDYIEQLQQEIKKLKREKNKQEAEIRKEVANEASAAVLNLEKFYSDRIKEEKELAEQYAEKRIALIIEQTENTRKRQKEFYSDTEDEFEKQLAERERNIKELELVVEEVKGENSLLRDEIKALRQSNTRLSISQAKIRRESSMHMFQNSFHEYNKKQSLDVSWATVSSEEANASLLETESKYEQACQTIAEKDGKILELMDENARLNELISCYEHRLANQADKKRKLTLDNALLKKELQLNKDFKNLKIEAKENIPEVYNDADDLDRTIPLKDVQNTPKQTGKSDVSLIEESPRTPDTVKKLFKPSDTVFLTSPLEEKVEKDINIHTRVLEEIQHD